MIIEANQHNIAWLTDRLYEVAREVAANGCANPTFILLTKGKSDRYNVEQVFWNFFRSKYALPEDMCRHFIPESVTSKASYFHLPGVPCRIVLMDI